MAPPHYDLVILGSGSTAFAAAIRAGELGKRVVMTEARTVGGTCVNRGCLPSKHLIEAAKLLHDARNPRYPGLTPCELPLDFAQLIAAKDDLIHVLLWLPASSAPVAAPSCVIRLPSDTRDGDRPTLGRR